MATNIEKFKKLFPSLDKAGFCIDLLGVTFDKRHSTVQLQWPCRIRCIDRYTLEELLKIPEFMHIGYVRRYIDLEDFTKNEDFVYAEFVIPAKIKK
jgi:hypothetical protein